MSGRHAVEICATETPAQRRDVSGAFSPVRAAISSKELERLAEVRPSEGVFPSPRSS